MRLNHLTIFFAVLAAASLPRTAHAQDFAYDSYGVYDPNSNEVSGYSITVDYMGYGVDVRADSDLLDQGQSVAASSYIDIGDAEADVYWSPGRDGDFQIEGSHLYWCGGWNWIGDSLYSLWVPPPAPPTVEYPSGYLDEMPGELLDYGYVDAYGTVYNVTLDPDAANYLVSNGFLQAGALAPELVLVPGVGEVVEVVIVGYIVYEAVQWLHMRGLGSDPPIIKSLPASVAGTRDGNGNCNQNQPIPNVKWQAKDRTGPVHWHWKQWNQDPDCTWHISTRYEGPSDPGPGYWLIPGIWGNQ